MKTLPLFATAIIIALTMQAQIVTQQFNIRVPCCNDSTTFDIGNSGYNNTLMQWSTGFDSKSCGISSMDSLFFSTLLSDSGQPFHYYFIQGAIAETTEGCSWDTGYWEPNSGIKYLGFSKVNGTNDTIFGWLKLNFIGSPTNCNDTIIVLEEAFCNTPNTHLFAGQTELFTVINNLPGNKVSILLPNPVRNTFYLQLFSIPSAPTFLCLFDALGRQIKYEKITEMFTAFDRMNISNGIYFWQLYNDDQIIGAGKIVFEPREE